MVVQWMHPAFMSRVMIVSELLSTQCKVKGTSSHIDDMREIELYGRLAVVWCHLLLFTEITLDYRYVFFIQIFYLK